MDTPLKPMVCVSNKNQNVVALLAFYSDTESVQERWGSTGMTKGLASTESRMQSWWKDVRTERAISLYVLAPQVAKESAEGGGSLCDLNVQTWSCWHPLGRSWPMTRARV